MGIPRVLAVLVLAVSIGAGTALVAQEAQPAAPSVAPDSPEEGRALLGQFTLQPRELDQIERILAKDEDTLAKARAEIQIAQARLARLMLDESVDMNQVQAVVKSSLDSELTVRMIQIGRQIAIRKVVGDERWAAMFRMSRYVAGLERSGRLRDGAAAGGGLAAERRARLIALLLRLN